MKFNTTSFLMPDYAISINQYSVIADPTFSKERPLQTGNAMKKI